jgi:hypothetical protein
MNETPGALESRLSDQGRLPRSDGSRALIAALGVSKDTVIITNEEAILAELRPEFIFQELRHEKQITPWQSEQAFIYFRFQSR